MALAIKGRSRSRRSSHRLLAASKRGEPGFFLLDSEFRVLQFNRVARAFFLPQSKTGQALGDVSPGLAQVLDGPLHQAARTGEPALHIEFLSSTAGKRDTPRLRSASCFPINDGGSLKFVVIVEDATESSESAPKLPESETWLNALMENSPNVLFLKDREGKYLVVSRQFEEAFGIEAGQAIGKTDEELFSKDLASAFRANDIKVIETGVPMIFEEHAFYSDGLHVNIVHKFPLRDSAGNIYAVGGIVTDITERKKAEELAQSQLQLLEMATEAIVALKLDMTIQYWNRGAERVYGWKREEAVGKSVRALLQTQFAKEPEEVLVELFRKGYWEGEGTQLKRDGTRIPVAARFSLQRDEAGTPAAVLAIYIDVSQRKQTEEKLRESEEYFRLMVEGMKEYAIIRLDLDGTIVSWNVGAERITGYHSEEVFGKHFSCLYPAEDRKARRPEQALAIAAAQDSYRDEGWRLRKDGTRFWADIVIIASRNEDGSLRGFTKITRDASERKQAEEARRRFSGELLKLQDRERRQLARELHDSTAQQLTALATYLAVIGKSSRLLPASARRALDECRSLAEQCHREIRTFSYLLHPPILDEIGLPDALRWYCDGFTKRSGIPVDLTIPSDLGRMSQEVEGTVFRIVQESLVNVHRHSGSPTARIRVDRNDHELIVEVQDEGRGMSKEVLADGRINRANLGVGIAGMQERIRSLQGRLDIESGGRGTTVRTIIPISEDGK